VASDWTVLDLRRQYCDTIVQGGGMLFPTEGEAARECLKATLDQCAAYGMMLSPSTYLTHVVVLLAIGAALRQKVPLGERCLLTTGRISSEILVKAAKARIPVVVSRSAATELAVVMAEELGLTAVGFARGQRLNVYSMPQRIVP